MEPDRGRSPTALPTAGTSVMLSHQIAVPAQDGVRPDEEPQPAQNLAWQRCQEGGEEGPAPPSGLTWSGRNFGNRAASRR